MVKKLITIAFVLCLVAPALASPDGYPKTSQQTLPTTDWPTLSFERFAARPGQPVVRTQVVSPDAAVRRVRRRGWLRHFAKKPKSATVAISVYAADQANRYGRVVVNVVGYSQPGGKGALAGGASTTTFRLERRLYLPTNDANLVNMLVDEFVVPNGKVLVGAR